MAFEKITGRFAVSAGAITAGTFLAYGGAVTVGASLAAVPATFGISAVGVFVGLTVIATGEVLITFGTDIYINEINALLGTSVAGPADVLPIFPRFTPIFKEPLFDKLDRALSGSLAGCALGPIVRNGSDASEDLLITAP